MAESFQFRLKINAIHEDCVEYQLNTMALTHLHHNTG